MKTKMSVLALTLILGTAVLNGTSAHATQSVNRTPAAAVFKNPFNYIDHLVEVYEKHDIYALENEIEHARLGNLVDGYHVLAESNESSSWEVSLLMKPKVIPTMDPKHFADTYGLEFAVLAKGNRGEYSKNFERVDWAFQSAMRDEGIQMGRGGINVVFRGQRHQGVSMFVDITRLTDYQIRRLPEVMKKAMNAFNKPGQASALSRL